MGGKTQTEETNFGGLTPSPVAAVLVPRPPGVNRARWSGCQATNRGDSVASLPCVGAHHKRQQGLLSADLMGARPATRTTKWALPWVAAAPGTPVAAQ